MSHGSGVYNDTKVLPYKCDECGSINMMFSYQCRDFKMFIEIIIEQC